MQDMTFTEFHRQFLGFGGWRTYGIPKYESLEIHYAREHDTGDISISHVYYLHILRYKKYNKAVAFIINEGPFGQVERHHNAPGHVFMVPYDYKFEDKQFERLLEAMYLDKEIEIAERVSTKFADKSELAINKEFGNPYKAIYEEFESCNLSRK